jgi:hypothetical protein
LQINVLPSDFIGKWKAVAFNIQSINYYSTGIGLLTILLIYL